MNIKSYYIKSCLFCLSSAFTGEQGPQYIQLEHFRAEISSKAGICQTVVDTPNSNNIMTASDFVRVLQLYESECIAIDNMPYYHTALDTLKDNLKQNLLKHLEEQVKFALDNNKLLYHANIQQFKLFKNQHDNIILYYAQLDEARVIFGFQDTKGLNTGAIVIVNFTLTTDGQAGLHQIYVDKGSIQFSHYPSLSYGLLRVIKQVILYLLINPVELYLLINPVETVLQEESSEEEFEVVPGGSIVLTDIKAATCIPSPGPQSLNSKLARDIKKFFEKLQ